MFWLLLSYFLKAVVAFAATFCISLLLTSIRFIASESQRRLRNCKLYVGHVKHSRLKGGAVHSFEYPIFFSYIDLDEIQSVGYSLWPIFVSNDKGRERKFPAFCSLDSAEHLKCVALAVASEPLFSRAARYLNENGIECAGRPLRLLTHLTYFGYCFNPVSFFYVFNRDGEGETGHLHGIIAEVSNTPWIEQHPYILHETVAGVAVDRSAQPFNFNASWDKAFHVSPFMEMDYKYNFQFTYPKEDIKIRAKMMKLSTGDVWFTANTEVRAIDFNPWNLCYVLLWYPFHTRIIQILIHYEAVKIFIKGVPVFPHPNDADVDFGMGITGNRLIRLYSVATWPFRKLHEIFFVQQDKKFK